MNKPIAITMGDPSGVGPEIISALISANKNANIIIVGDATLVSGAVSIDTVNEYVGGIALLSVPLVDAAIAGQPSLANAPVIVSWIETAVSLVRSGVARAMVTAPINKDNLVSGAKFQYPGHTEFLAHLDGDKDPVMMLAAEGILRVVPTTIHCPLSEVSTRLTPDLLTKTITTTYSSLKRFGIENPRIAIAGLNPHAGENGKIGTEEQDWIFDSVAKCRSNGIDIFGPLSADTMFHERARQNYDVAICMYHDQALIPIKTLAFDEGVNVTLGLSFLRTSPDHGTAYDIAGKGVANPTSMIAAFDFADRWS